MLKKLILFLFCSGLGWSQSITWPLLCPANTMLGFVASAPACIKLGPGLTIDSTGTLTVAVQSASAAPTMHAETFNVGALSIPSTTTTYQAVITKAPVPGSSIIAIYSTAMLLYSGFAAVIPAPTSGLQVSIPLPAYRPLLSTDTFTLIYWSLN